MDFDYFYGDQSEAFAFYRTPKLFYTDEKFRTLSSDAKILYGIMLDRLSLSVKNDWRDDDGRVYIYMTLDSVEEMMGCARQKAVALVKELNDFGLIEKKKQGLCKPTRIYVKNFVRVWKSYSQEFENHTSGSLKITPPDEWKSYSNNTEINNTDINKTNPVLTDSDIDHIMLYLEENYSLTTEKKIKSAINVVAMENKYHPIQEKLNSLVWDKKERIKDVLYHFLGADRNVYIYEAMKVLLLGAISRVFRPGTKFEYMLILVGGQGAGKSTFFRFLAMNDSWFTDDLKKLDDENVFRKMQGHLIIELSEMIATASARSIEDIKSFISRQSDIYKVPYETQPKDRPRQCVFGGTSNAMDTLPLDRTGNRRFMPVMVYPDRAECHILENEELSRKYIEQVWAEAMEIYRSGEFRLMLSRESAEYLKDYQKQFMPEDADAGMILAFLDNFKGDRVCSKLLWKEALHRDYEPKRIELKIF